MNTSDNIYKQFALSIIHMHPALLYQTPRPKRTLCLADRLGQRVRSLPRTFLIAAALYGLSHACL